MIRVWHSTWNEPADKFEVGHTDYADGNYIDTEGDILYVRAQNSKIMAAYNRWDWAEVILPDSTKLKPPPPPMPGEQPLPLEDVNAQLAGVEALSVRRNTPDEHHLTL